ncbi:hypothetical protein D7Z26_03480 [Cohnella endophytica]|uniref:Uncharacterized protein n=1 Tax=Cohnella endophytica TaxID=2419778 RepID=A0A494Y4T3_9BACL|nr:hypothetical protein [Cohnella endophytica]RKP57060.1 hypothetical protein D7Z26_03480 [Cohnella endophytica]
MPVIPYKQWSLLLIAGLVVVLSLSRLPSVERGFQERRQAVAVFQPNTSNWLTDDNLVDALSKLSLTDRLVKVGWDHAILTVDLLGDAPIDAWADMGKLLAFAYAEERNVKQLLIRVYVDRSGGNRSLMLAAETRKSDWSEEELADPLLTTRLADIEQASKIRLSVTPLGKHWLANFAN